MKHTSSRSIELQENPGFQLWEWRLQRLGWWALSLVVLAAMLGLFGKGLLSGGEARNAPGSLRVRYERFARVGASNRITLDLPPAQSSDSVLLHLNRRYFDSVRIETVTPGPAGIDVGPDEVVFRFSTAATGRTPVSIVFDVEPLRAGRLPAVLRTNTEPMLTFTQLVYF
jgi:hypothetical protein